MLRSNTLKEGNENEPNLHITRNNNTILPQYLSAKDLELFNDKLQNVEDISPERHKMSSKQLGLSYKEPERAIDETDLPNKENSLPPLDHHLTGSCSKHHGKSYC